MSKLTPEQYEVLLSRAAAARERAYAPYSHYHVGAAVLMESGQVFSGCNVENAVYPLGLCAERVAVFKAVSEGERRVQAVAVSTENGGSPCGACRQVLREFGDETMIVLLVDASGRVREMTLGELLPESFSARDLEAAAHKDDVSRRSSR